MLENIKLAFKSILSHKLRSLLTMLGIIIGIAAIISIVSTIEGTNQQIKNNLIGDGKNTVEIILTENDTPVDYAYSQVSVKKFNLIDKNKLRSFSKVKNIGYYRAMEYSSGAVLYQQNQINSKLMAVDSNVLEMLNYHLISGIDFRPEHFTTNKKVVIIDELTALSLGVKEPLGQVIDVYGQPFEIIGIVSKSSSKKTYDSLGAFFNQEFANRATIFMPLDSWDYFQKFDLSVNILAQAETTDDMPKVGKTISEWANGQISVKPESGIKYTAKDVLQQAKRLQDLANTTNQQLIWIASISLLVGGIGVMNIMLVSVSERTKEIGLKKAIGATRKNILSQFLIEAGILTLIGGILGVVSGIGLAWFVSTLTQAPIVISIPISLLAMALSMALGIIFGLLPAIKASNLDPIQALRYE